MKIPAAALLLALVLPVLQALADAPLDEPARRLAAYEAGQEVAAGDPRVVRFQGQLTQVAKVTGEGEDVIAAACVRTARHVFDVTRSKATPGELLEVLVRHARPGTPMQDTFRDYVAARRNAPG
ncbi:MAG: hypothetical protein JNM82_00185, partial [Rhodocyclaceae bacterium]|nr:hypothetical protein [Rhodocyclaceae bacterium]